MLTRPTPTAAPRAFARAASLTALTLAALVAGAGPATAHGKWFAESAEGGDWSFFFSAAPLTATVAVVVATVVWRTVARRTRRAGRPELGILSPLGRLAPYVPRLLAVHLGVTLLAFAVTGCFLVPPLPLADVLGGDLAGIVQGVLGIWLITGVHLRVPALLIVLLGPVVLLAAGPVALLEVATTLAVALFLAVLPPSDAAHGRVDPDPDQVRWALFLLRVLVAVALVTLAFSEKFTNPELARNLLHDHPQLNIFALVGLPVGTDLFIALAGAIELLFGLLILSGAMPQLVVLAALVPFNVTLLMFGTTELVGHLPLYGAFLALLVYGSRWQTAGAVPWFPGAADRRALAHRLRARQSSRPQGAWSFGPTSPADPLPTLGAPGGAGRST